MKKNYQQKNIHCKVCGGKDFSENPVLWPELIDSWQLSVDEVSYINRQQGHFCIKCNNNLRAQGLAVAILREFEFQGTLTDFCSPENQLSVLEINKAGNLTSFFEKLRQHKLIEYPEFDMQNLNIESSSYDLIVHSDTLEHVKNPERGLSECSRVLKKDGKCIFTVPMIVNRLSRSRDGLEPSYHGQSIIDADDQKVWTEFGVDAWKVVIKAGFNSCEIFSYEYPAALVIIAKK